MNDFQHCAFILIAIYALYWLVVLGAIAIADAFHSDPIDAHFDTAITEPEFCAETFADLRAPWAKWEHEMTA